MQDPDLTTLALGTDLTGLGLHLNSPENVYSTFASPWAEQPLKPEPEFLVSTHDVPAPPLEMCLPCHCISSHGIPIPEGLVENPCFHIELRNLNQGCVFHDEPPELPTDL